MRSQVPAANKTALGRWVGKGGKASDLQLACDLVAEGGSLAEVAKAHPSAYVRNYKGLGSLSSSLRPVDTGEWRGHKEVYFWWGPTGCGKTRRAHEFGRVFEPLRAGKGTIWWDGYGGEETILFDDLRWDEVRLSDLLRWTDGRYFTAAVKGGTVGVTAMRFVITSNERAQLLWPSQGLAPLARRLSNDMEQEFHTNPDAQPRVVTGHGVGPGNTQAGPTDLWAEAAPEEASDLVPRYLEDWVNNYM